MASIVKRKNRYAVVYSYEDENGNKRQKWESFETNAEAKKRKTEVEFQQATGTLIIPEAKTVKDLLDEYMTGDDPVFVSKRVHIGTDEYPAGYNELMRAYTDELIDHVNSRGYIPRCLLHFFCNRYFLGNIRNSYSYRSCNLPGIRPTYDYWYVSLPCRFSLRRPLLTDF